jgi:hypothetical protein
MIEIVCPYPIPQTGFRFNLENPEPNPDGETVTVLVTPKNGCKIVRVYPFGVYAGGLREQVVTKVFICDNMHTIAINAASRAVSFHGVVSKRNISSSERERYEKEILEYLTKTSGLHRWVEDAVRRRAKNFLREFLRKEGKKGRICQESLASDPFESFETFKPELQDDETE